VGERRAGLVTFPGFQKFDSADFGKNFRSRHFIR
jgi:hypothetical protein